MRVLVTGASGFVGGALCEVLAESGHQPVALSRRPVPGLAALGIPWFRCDLPGEIDAEAFQRGDMLVHCAYSTRFKSRSEAVAINLDGTQALLRLFRERGGAKFVLISSVAAHDEAESLYGKSKLQLEGELDPSRDLAIRPGLVIGRGGLYGRMSETLRKSGWVPLFYGGTQQVQTIWIRDLCRGIQTALELDLTGRLTLAHPVQVPIRDLYCAIGRSVGTRVRFVRLPGGLVRAGLQLAEGLGLNLPVTSENLLGLKHARVFDVSEDLARLKLSPVDCQEAIRRSVT